MADGTLTKEPFTIEVLNIEGGDIEGAPPIVSFRCKKKGAAEKWTWKDSQIDTNVTGISLPAKKVVEMIEKDMKHRFNFHQQDESLNVIVKWTFQEGFRDAVMKFTVNPLSLGEVAADLKRLEMTVEKNLNDQIEAEKKKDVDKFNMIVEKKMYQQEVAAGQQNISLNSDFTLTIIPNQSAQCIIHVDCLIPVPSACNGWAPARIINNGSCLHPGNYLSVNRSNNADCPWPYHKKVISNAIAGKAISFKVEHQQKYPVPFVRDVILRVEYI